MKVKAEYMKGTVEAIASKSFAHRAFIAASLSEGQSFIRLNTTSKDIEATISCLRELGSEISKKEEGYLVKEVSIKRQLPKLDFNESGSSYRFLLPVACAIYDEVFFTGAKRLSERPIFPLLEVLKEKGLEFTGQTLPFKSSGKLERGGFEIGGGVSSQFVSGLLLASPLLEDETMIIIKDRLESSAYVDITIDVMKKFGLVVEKKTEGYRVKKGKYKACDIKVEGDWSNSCFFLAAAALKGEVEVDGLNLSSCQGDKKILEILKAFGSEIIVDEDKVYVKSDKRNNLKVDLRQIPDMLPVLAVVAASCGGGRSVFENGSRLRLKESDRLESTKAMITSLGGKAELVGDDLYVYGTGGLKGGAVKSFNDHRIVMASAVSSLICDEKVEILGHEAVEKSYPKFFDDFKQVGGEYEL